jgi:hypothetical protein
LVTDVYNDIPSASLVAIRRISTSLEANSLDGELLEYTIQAFRRCIEENLTLDEAFRVIRPVPDRQHGSQKSNSFQIACAHQVLTRYGGMKKVEADEYLAELNYEVPRNIQRKRAEWPGLDDRAAHKDDAERFDLDILLHFSGDNLRHKILPLLSRNSKP